MKIRTRLGKLAGVALALAAGGAFVLASPAKPAVAFFSGGLFLDVQPQSPATLEARGAAVDVPIEITCNATQFAQLSVQVTERVGGGVASGSTFLDVACSGSHELLLVKVPASPAGKPFAKGTAVVDARLFGCNQTTCGEESTTATVTVTR